MPGEVLFKEEAQRWEAAYARHISRDRHIAWRSCDWL
jgi:hypothetical protein